MRIYHRFYYGSEIDVQLKMSEIDEQLLLSPKQMGLREVLSRRKIVTGIAIGATANIAQVFSGSMATISYSTTMFDSVGFADWAIPYLPTLGSLASAILTLPALHLVESCGRRPLFLWTLAACAIGDAGLFAFSAITHYSPTSANWANICFLIAFVLYGIGYNVGPGSTLLLITFIIMKLIFRSTLLQVRWLTFCLGSWCQFGPVRQV